MRFRDRQHAGQQLAATLEALREHQRWTNPIVLALPRGGVPIAAEVARVLGAPLDVVIARKIGVPGEPEVGIGAIAGDDPPLFDRQLRKENAELKRANEILKAASVFFAQEIDRPRTRPSR